LLRSPSVGAEVAGGPARPPPPVRRRRAFPRDVMISLLFLLSVVWLGLILDEDFALSRGDLALRLASAITVGFFWSAWLIYLLAWCFGFQVWTVAAGTGLILLFNAHAWRRRRRNLAWLASLRSLDRGFWRAYGIITALIVSFFVFEVWTTADGDILYRGNFTDLAFHMGTVSAFLEQSAFPPLNPQSAAAKLSYHFMGDFFSAVLCRGGFSLFYSLKVPMVMLAFSLAALTCHLFRSVLQKRTAALAAGILFFFGHIGFFNLFYGIIGYPVGNTPLSLTSWASIEDHLSFPYFNFLNVLVDFFQPQLAFLFGFPLAALLLLVLFRKVAGRAPADRTTYFVVATVALLPLSHMHSFMVLAPVVGLLVLFERRTVPWPASAPAASGPELLEEKLPSPRWGHPGVKAAAGLVAGLAVALQFAFILSQKKSADFSGFDVGARLGALSEIPDFLHARRLWFWVRAAGAPFVVGLMGFCLPVNFRCRQSDPERRANLGLLVLFAVTAGYFVIINFYRFTPSWGDSNKFFLYWDLMLCLYAGRLLARWWEGRRWQRILAAAVLLFGAILPSAVEWNLRYRHGASRLLSACDRMVADWIRLNTPKDAVFLSANSYTHYVTALAGRRVVNGSYTRETGFADDALENAVRRAFRTADPSVITTVQVTHIIVGPEERSMFHISRPLLARRQKLVYDMTCRDAHYSIYQVQPVSAEDIAEEQRQEAARGFVWLSDQDPASIHQFGNLQYDENFDQAPLTLNGQVYAHGLGTHAPSELSFDLDGKYRSFESDIGIDDRQRGGPGSVIFKVLVDDRPVFTSYVLRAGAPHESVRVDLTGAKSLVLVVEDAGDGNHDDHANWAGARLLLPRSAPADGPP
jgi:hypothetical protein